MQVLYDIALGIYLLGIKLASFFNKKAIAWIKGRKNIFQQIQQSEVSKAKNVIWIHVASLGEFEQGRPIIDALKDSYPTHQVLLTFFSPSGYEIRKAHPIADYVFYLPLDTKNNARQFLDLVKPKLAIFVKYDLWYHYLKNLSDQQIPFILVSALFRKNQFYFKPYGKWFLKIIKNFTHIFAQNDTTAKLLNSYGINQVSITGDNRVDRVVKVSKSPLELDKVVHFIENKPVLILGSTWQEDESILQHYINTNPGRWKYIIAPHNISQTHIIQIEERFSTVKKVRYSKLSQLDSTSYEMLIIDNIGLLPHLYQFAKIAYVGGAFGKGLHNTLEPIAFKIPVIFGPKYKKFEEAKYLIEAGGGFSINESDEFEQKLIKLEDPVYYAQCAGLAYNYIQNNKGATKRVMEYIKQKKLL